MNNLKTIKKQQVLTLALICLGMFATNGLSNTTNQIPFDQDFEGPADGTPLIGTDGWYGGSNTYAIIKNIDYSAHYSGNYPMPGTSHTNVMLLQTEGNIITNEIEDYESGGESVSTNVWFDSIVQFAHWSEEYYPESITSNDQTQCSFFVNTNNHLVVYHYDKDGPSNRFTVITNSSITNGQYSRITVEMDYLTDKVFGAVEYTYYKVYIDQVPVTNAAAYVGPDETSGQPGTWFICANYNKAKKYMTGLALTGTGQLDDMVVTTTDPYGGPPPTQYTISTTVNDPARGSISPDSDTVNEGANSTEFSVAASNGYYVAQLLTNTVQVFTNSSPSLTSTNYTWPSVMANGTITVNFASSPLVQLTGTVNGGNGAIDPTSTNVAPGSDVAFSLIADSHYHVSLLETNSAATGGSWDNYSTNEIYVWSNIVAAGTITVTFTENVWTNETPESWLDAYYGSTNYEEAASSDTDGDDQEAWAEYLAGTDPTDSNSVFRIDDAWQENGTNYLRWVTHHVGDQTSLPPYNVVYATNMLNADWSAVTDSVERMDGAYTNIWSWPAAQGAFYRIVATNR